MMHATMKICYIFIIVVCAALLSGSGMSSGALAAQSTEKQVGGGGDILDQAFREEQKQPPAGGTGAETTEATPEEEAPPEEEPAEEPTPPAPLQPPQQVRGTPAATGAPIPPEEAKPATYSGEGEGGGDEARKILIDGMVDMNYVFNDSPESFIIHYHFRIEGEIKAKTAVIRGDAQIDTKVDGFLAKWPNGECSLTITIPKAPFQVTFKRNDEENATIDLTFTKPIVETWESKCNFGEGAKPFVTRGDPEKWMERALAKTSPPLKSLVATVNATEKTTNKFLINSFQINDPPLGTIEAQGTGVVTIIPAGAQE
jgi:hypothetical protein